MINTVDVAFENRSQVSISRETCKARPEPARLWMINDTYIQRNNTQRILSNSMLLKTRIENFHRGKSIF